MVTASPEIDQIIFLRDLVVDLSEADIPNVSGSEGWSCNFSKVSDLHRADPVVVLLLWDAIVSSEGSRGLP